MGKLHQRCKECKSISKWPIKKNYITRKKLFSCSHCLIILFQIYIVFININISKRTLGGLTISMRNRIFILFVYPFIAAKLQLGKTNKSCQDSLILPEATQKLSHISFLLKFLIKLSYKYKHYYDLSTDLCRQQQQYCLFSNEILSDSAPRQDQPGSS